ncbi:MAG TPA: hypothetical protein VF597_03225 [Candidatus Saccharimonadales bacterium]|jgi:hypothetical protein
MLDHAQKLDAIVRQLNELARQLFDLARLRKKVTDEYKADQEARKSAYEAERDRRKVAFDTVISPIQFQIDQARKEMTELVSQHRSALLTGSLKSFATTMAIFSYRKAPLSFKLEDSTAATAVARKLGILRQVGKMRISWDIDPAKLKTYLDTHPGAVESFADCVRFADPDAQSLSAKPNDAYLTMHDSDQLSDAAIKLSD